MMKDEGLGFNRHRFNGMITEKMLYFELSSDFSELGGNERA